MKAELRLWLRMLTTTTTIEAEIRRRLRVQFNTTLPRFDLLAALDRAPEGLTLGEVSARMMVTNGNVTGLATRLEAEGLVVRRVDPNDRRAVRLTLTEEGRAVFDTQSAAHGRWIKEMFAGLAPEEREALHQLLGRAKTALSTALETEEAL
ncbi:MarR family transcriptional regulator [Rhodovarius crocodyli]|uniref:MarR family transcriptional regulator n=1 Tax=Rhodovarius crocodyli TaxID=1979269 RepID=A0A437M1N7_9PROT|nr:MarR family transcriptional regulator [Rhodovarius crocodyli]RVT91475.1 MarR family transcriptional regulator [Rhodovarius crocodyli]